MSDSTDLGETAESRPEATASRQERPQNGGAAQNAGAAPRPGLDGGPAPRIEAASSDLTAAADATPLPGAHRGGFSRELTGPVAITIQSAPVEPGTEDAPGFAPTEWVVTAPRARFGAWGLGFAVLGLLVSFLVGWGFLLGVVGIVAGAMALRRGEPRAIPIWAIVLASLSILYSAGWLLWAASQGALALG